MTAPAPPVYANAMWRTGSTYLASRFAAAPGYAMFYEPCHEYVGSRREIAKARGEQAQKQSALRHPGVGGGYFDAYEQPDPESGRALCDLYDPAACLARVYATPSDRTIAFIRACTRVAAAQERTAFLGFCRAGLQQEELAAAIPGTRLHLWRDPREQFGSYGWPANDYFVPGTVLQLILSPVLRRPAAELVPGLLSSPEARAAAWLPDRAYRMRYRLGRRIARRIAAPDLYALFHLAWLASFRSAERGTDFSVSLSRLAADPALRRAVEDRFAITLDGVAATPPAPAFAFDPAPVEARVERLYAAHCP